MEKVNAHHFKRIVVIGGSAGALEVLLQILPALKQRTAPPIVIILHRKGADDGGLAALLASRTPLHIKEVEDKDALRAGSIFIAPGDYHLLFESDGTLSLDDSEKVAFSRPSIDVAFQSAAEAHRSAVTGILLSGANADGAEGLAAIKAAGGITIAQSPDSAGVPFMPQQAIDAGAVHFVQDVAEIVRYMNNFSDDD